MTGIFTGFAVGSINNGIGLLEYNEHELNYSVKHVNFWTFRDSNLYFNLSKNFNYYNF